jgi:sulfur carrier protein
VTVHVNGRPREVDASTTLGALVDAQVPDRRGVAVALDGEVVSRAAWDTTTLTDGTHVEIVGAVQGG